MAIAGNWPNLPDHIQHLIMDRLLVHSLPHDYKRFGTVCVSWRSAYNAHNPPRPLPLFMVPPPPSFSTTFTGNDDRSGDNKKKNKNKKDIRRFYNIVNRNKLDDDDTVKKVDDVEFPVRLFNPFLSPSSSSSSLSSSSILLPSLDSLPVPVITSSSSSSLLRNLGGGGYNILHKAISNTTDYRVMFIYGGEGGKFLAIDCRRGTVVVCDDDDDDTPPQGMAAARVLLHQLQPPPPPPPHPEKEYGLIVKYYLVESSGGKNLLQEVHRHRRRDKGRLGNGGKYQGRLMYTTLGFKVYKTNVQEGITAEEEEEEDYEWVEMMMISLGGDTVFLGDNDSISIGASHSQYPGNNRRLLLGGVQKSDERNGGFKTDCSNSGTSTTTERSASWVSRGVSFFFQKINRPVTRRSFCEQLLLANAQAAPAATKAAENNNKVAVPVVVVDGVAVVKKGVEAAAGTQKKVVVAVEPKPDKTEIIIEISPPDTVDKEVLKEEEEEKQVHNLTSVLTATSSKVAFGLTDKPPPKDVVVDIDAADVDNQLAAVEYVEDLYKCYKLAESSSRVDDYMDTQPEISIRKRAFLVDWLIRVHNEFKLMPETLYLTIYIMDRFLSIKTITNNQFQLLCIGAMLIASKYEEIDAPEVNDFVSISGCLYSPSQVLEMEEMILDRLEWTLTVPTPYVFLVRFIKASSASSVSDQTHEMEENMVFYLAELCLMHYHTIIMYSPSMIAASAVYVARRILAKTTPLWTETLKLHTGFSEPQIRDCAKRLVRFHAKAGLAESKVKGVYMKYSESERGSVALLRPRRK